MEAAGYAHYGAGFSVVSHALPNISVCISKEFRDRFFFLISHFDFSAEFPRTDSLVLP